MKTIARFLAALIALLTIASGALAEAVDPSVLATVNGKTVPVEAAYEEYAYYAMLYELYGYSEEDIAQLRSDVAESYAQLEVIYQKFEELGLSVDMEQITADATAQYEAVLDDYLSYVDGEDLTDEEIRQAAVDMMAEDGYDEDYFFDYTYSNARVQAVIDDQTADIVVDEDDVKALYEQRLAEDKETYEGNPALYDDAVSYGETVLYAPEGMRMVKHILLLLDNEAESRVYDLEEELEQIQSDAEEEGADVEALTLRETEIRQELDEIFAALEPKAQEVLDRLANGEEFAALLEEYGEDPGMTSEPYATEGYRVWDGCENWIEAFRDGAMALEQVGDVSQPIRTSYGLHIIRYESDVPAGERALEDVSETLAAELLAERKNERVSALLSEWYEAAEIALYPDNLLTEDEVE